MDVNFVIVFRRILRVNFGGFCVGVAKFCNFCPGLALSWMEASGFDFCAEVEERRRMDLRRRERGMMAEESCLVMEGWILVLWPMGIIDIKSVSELHLFIGRIFDWRPPEKKV